MSSRPIPLRAPGRTGSPTQRGQALLLALMLLFAGTLGLYLMFSAGQVLATRQRLNNAADAAAYSAAVWRARVMNYQAYANRAIVAQEVAVAQAVTLVSWARYFQAFAGTASALSAAYPPVATVLAVSRELAADASELAQMAAGEEIVARAAHARLLAAGQELMQLAVGTFAAGAVANEVARANDPRFFAFALGGDGGPLASRPYEGDDRARLREVVTGSLDPFVGGPRGLDMTLLPLPSLCFGNPIAGPGSWFNELRKRGGTLMAPDLERWEAADTHSLHTHVPRHGFLGLFRGCHLTEALPLGWGAAEAGGSGTGEGAGVLQADPGGTRLNGSATALAEADSAARPVPGLSAYPGLPVVRDLDYPALPDSRFPISRVAVLARTQGADARTATALNLGTGRLRLTERFAGGRLWSLAAAEVYFRRPPAAPNEDPALAERIEYASLYSPYWQARLAEPTEAERALAQGYAR